MVFDAEFLKPFPSVVRYFTTMVNQPAFAKVIGKVEMCTKVMQYDRAPPILRARIPHSLFAGTHVLPSPLPALRVKCRELGVGACVILNDPEWP